MSIPIDRLIKRVEVIARECAPEPVDSEGNVVKQDEFTKKKKDISQHIKTVRAVRAGGRRARGGIGWLGP